MENMTKRIIKANHLDASCVDEFGTEEYNIDESIRNLSDLDNLYEDFVKDCGDNELIADFRRDFLNIEPKFVFESTEDKWESIKGEDDWDFPKDELSDILKGDLSYGCVVYVHYIDCDGEDRFGEVTTLGGIEYARQYFGQQGTPMENLI